MKTASSRHCKKSCPRRLTKSETPRLTSLRFRPLRAFRRACGWPMRPLPHRPPKKNYALDEKKVLHTGPWCSTPICMPNQGSPDKDYLTIRIPRTLKRRLEIFAKARGESVTDVVINFIMKAVSHLNLTAEDHIEIAAAITRATKSIKTKKQTPQKN